MEERKPEISTADYRDLNYAKDYYIALQESSAKLLNLLNDIKEPGDSASEKDLRRWIVEIQNVVDDSFMIFKYKKAPEPTKEATVNAIQTYNIISETIEEVLNQKDPPSTRQFELLNEKIKKMTKEVLAYSKARLSELTPLVGTTPTPAVPPGSLGSSSS